MNEVLQLSEAVFAWILQTSWQAGVLALVIVLAQAIFRRQLSPAWRYGLWLLLIVRLLLPNSLQTSWSLYNVARLPAVLQEAEAPSRFELAERVPLHSRVVTPPKRETDSADSSPHNTDALPMRSVIQQKNSLGQPWSSLSWHRIAFFVWTLGVCGFASRLAWSNLRFSRAIRGSPTPENAKLQLLKSAQETLGVRQSVDVLETNAVQSPAIHGLWRKWLLLPKRTFDLLSREELHCVFLHELAHIKRRDLEINWLASLLMVLHWFNPLLWLAFSRMRNDCELACDALVLTNLGSGHAESYGETIIKIVEHMLDRPSAPGVLALLENRQRLKERIGMIARFKHWPRWSVLTLSLSLGIAAVGLTNGGTNRVAPISAPNITNPETSQESGRTALPRGLHARVVDVNGNSVTNAYVECQGFDWRTATDAQGRFSWIGEQQPRTFQIRKGGYKTLVTGLLKPGDNELSLTLQRAPEMAGKVVDRETRQAIATFQVQHVRILQGPVMPSLSPHFVTGTSGVFKYSFADFFWPDSAFYIDAEGYMPILSRPLTSADDGAELTFELTRSQPVEGKVLTPQGTPAEKAEIRLWCGELNIPDIPQQHVTESHKDGVFTVPVILDGKVLVYHNSGYAEVPWKDFTAKSTVQLSEWGHVKGHWPKPLPNNRKVSLERMNWSGRMNTYTFPPPWTISSTEIKPDGRFEFEEGAPPGEYILTEWNNLKIEHPGGGHSMALLISKRVPLLVEAGLTTDVEVPTGRTVIGKLGVSDQQSLTNVHLPIVSLRLKQNEPGLKFPPLDPSLSDAQNFDRWKQHRQQALDYWLSEQGKAQRRAERIYEVPAESDGTLRIDNVPPGIYELQINAQRWSGKAGPEIRRQIAIPASAEGTPVDLGILQ